MYYATAKQMAKLDDLAIKNGLEIRQMMELAGWQMLNLFTHIKISKKSKITIVCGKGNQAGDGLCAGRYLYNSGYKVNFVLVAKDMSADSVHHLQLIKKMKLPVIYYPNSKTKAKKLIQNSDIIIDALIGYNLSGTPRGKFCELVEIMNQSKNKIISYDIPTGIDSTTGKCFLPCIKAWITLSLALAKKAFVKKRAKNMSGKIFIADIGIPEFIYKETLFPALVRKNETDVSFFAHSLENNKIAADSRPPFEKYKNGLVPL